MINPKTDYILRGFLRDLLRLEYWEFCEIPCRLKHNYNYNIN